MICLRWGVLLLLSLISQVCVAQSVNRISQGQTVCMLGQPCILELASKAPMNELITVKLQKGPTNDLQDVEVITTSALPGNFSWIPRNTLSPGADYAIKITQGYNINYSGPLVLVEPPPTTLDSTTHRRFTISTASSSTQVTSWSNKSLISTIASTPTATNRSPPTLLSAPGPPSRLGVGDKAAIGVGVSLGFIIFCSLGFCLYWRLYRNNSKKKSEKVIAGSDADTSSSSPEMRLYEIGEGVRSVEAAGRPLSELPIDRQRYEMASQQSIVELEQRCAELEA